jgi:hypothetical protein
MGEEEEKKGKKKGLFTWQVNVKIQISRYPFHCLLEFRVVAHYLINTVKKCQK